MRRGRPTKYSQEMLDNAYKYIDTYTQYGDMIPSVEGLADLLDVSRETLYEWGRVHEDFSDILARLKARQQKVLINNGLSGDFQPTITKLVLGLHGFHEKQDTELSGAGGGPLEVSVNFVKSNDA